MRGHPYVGQKCLNSHNFRRSPQATSSWSCGARAQSEVFSTRKLTSPTPVHEAGWPAAISEVWKLRSRSGRQEVTALSGWWKWVGVRLELPHSRTPNPHHWVLLLQDPQLRLRSERRGRGTPGSFLRELALALGVSFRWNIGLFGTMLKCHLSKEQPSKHASLKLSQLLFPGKPYFQWAQPLSLWPGLCGDCYPRVRGAILIPYQYRTTDLPPGSSDQQ